MIRKLALFAPFAVLALSACDGPSALTKAQPGECYAVTGRQSNGAPKWEKTPCAADAAATTTVAALPPAESVTPQAPAASPACPTAKPVSCPTVSAATGRVTRSSARGVERGQGKVTIRSRGGRSIETRDYARVHRDDDLLGGPEMWSGGSYIYRVEPSAPPMPPLPPTERYLGRDHAQGGYGEREYERYQGDDDFVPPPPPYERHSDRYQDGGQAYSERRDYRSAPPPAYRGEYSSREEGYSYRSEESSSSYSARSSASHGRRGPCCNRDRGTMAPMNGPHFPVDQDGFLTWRGKTPD